MKRRGFSLIEALVAMTFILIALIPMTAMSAAINKLYTTSAARERAMLLAMQKLDELEAERSTELFGGSQIVYCYNMTWTIGNPLHGLRDVKLTISWDDGHSKLEIIRQVSTGADNIST